ncbi:hypothetical protein N7470_006117 [Penicillium chermesinum]|nr:hypothetical protein N7470_006117 [Penicillium chermesinum]
MPSSDTEVERGTRGSIQEDQGTTEGASAIIPGRRSRSFSRFHEEHFNIRDPKRIQLIDAISDIRRHELVPSIFWALLNICDLRKLKKIRSACESTGNDSVDFCSYAWECDGFCATWGPSETIPETRPEKDHGFMSQATRNAACLRDRHRCALTGKRNFRLACIVPSWAHGIVLDEMRWSGERTVWNTIYEYWDRETADRWFKAAFTSHRMGVLPVDNSSNLICLNTELALAWELGVAAFRPLLISNERSKLVIEFHWLAVEDVNSGDFLDAETDMRKVPTPTKGLSSYEGLCARHRYSKGRALIKTGDRFYLTTDDPVLRPLPSFDLLELSFYMRRLIALSNCKRSYPHWPAADQDWVMKMKNDRLITKAGIKGAWPIQWFGFSEIKAGDGPEWPAARPEKYRTPSPPPPPPPHVDQGSESGSPYYLSWTGWKRATAKTHPDQVPLGMAHMVVNQTSTPLGVSSTSFSLRASVNEGMCTNVDDHA